MKKKLVCISIILIMMVIIPILALNDNINFTFNNKYTKGKPNNYSKTDICNILSFEFKPEYDTETLKAMAIIIQSNYSYNQNNTSKNAIKTLSKNDFYKKFGKPSSDYYKKIKSSVDEVFKYEIKIKNKNAYIPYSYIIKTNSQTKYPYIKKYASPWDSLKRDYSSSKVQSGISLNTLNNLCKNGYSHKQALSYFLKNAQLSKQ